MFLSKSDILKNVIYRNGTENNKRALSDVIIHETMCSLIENKIGFIHYKRLPL